MEIKSTHKGKTVKTVVIAAANEADALTHAMRHMGETPGSLFGHSVTQDHDGIFTVKLFTD